MSVNLLFANFWANVYHKKFKTGLINAVICNFVSLLPMTFNDA